MKTLELYCLDGTPLQIEANHHPSAVTIDGIDISADVLRELVRPDESSNRWLQFRRETVPGTTRDTIIVTSRFIPS